jgi:hypothetical protein
MFSQRYTLHYFTCHWQLLFMYVSVPEPDQVKKSIILCNQHTVNVNPLKKVSISSELYIYTHHHSYHQVITLTEKLQAKESSASEPEEQTVAAQETVYTLFQEDKLCSEIATGSAAAPAPGSNDSQESYFAGARSPPSSPEDDDCGCGGGDRTFFLPDALLATAVDQGLEGAAEEDGAQLNNWAWLWNDQQY